MDQPSRRVSRLLQPFRKADLTLLHFRRIFVQSYPRPSCSQAPQRLPPTRSDPSTPSPFGALLFQPIAAAARGPAPRDVTHRQGLIAASVKSALDQSEPICRCAASRAIADFRPPTAPVAKMLLHKKSLENAEKWLRLIGLDVIGEVQSEPVFEAPAPPLPTPTPPPTENPPPPQLSPPQHVVAPPFKV